MIGKIKDIIKKNPRLTKEDLDKRLEENKVKHQLSRVRLETWYMCLFHPAVITMACLASLAGSRILLLFLNYEPWQSLGKDLQNFSFALANIFLGGIFEQNRKNQSGDA